MAESNKSRSSGGKPSFDLHADAHDASSGSGQNIFLFNSQGTSVNLTPSMAPLHSNNNNSNHPHHNARKDGSSAGLASYQPQHSMGFAGIGFGGSVSASLHHPSSKSVRSISAVTGNGMFNHMPGAAAGGSGGGGGGGGGLGIGAAAAAAAAAGVAAALERQRMPLLQVIGEALRQEEFGNMEAQAKMLRRDAAVAAANAKSRAVGDASSTKPHSPAGATTTTSASGSPRSVATSLSPPTSRNDSPSSKIAPARRKDQVKPPSAQQPHQQHRRVLSNESQASRTANTNSAQSSDLNNNKPPRRHGNNNNNNDNDDDDDNDDDEEEDYDDDDEHGGDSSSPQWWPIRVEMSHDGLYRRRLTTNEEQEVAAEHHRTQAEVRDRSRTAHLTRMQEIEVQRKISERKSVFAERWRSFAQKKRHAQVQLLWSTLLLAVHMVRKWDRERRLRVASAMMARSVLPMLRWRRRRTERRRLKAEILKEYQAPPLTADMLMADKLLAFFGRAHLASIVQYARLEVFLRDYNLVYFREPGRDCFILVHGEVDVWIDGSTEKGQPKHMQQVAKLCAPAVVGSVGMVTKEKRNARITCRTDVIAYVIDHSDFIKEKPSKDILISAMAEARRQHLMNMTALYITYINPAALSRYYCMEHIPTSLLAEICKKLTPTMRKPGEYLIRAGERSSSLFFLFEGKVDICPPEDDLDTPHRTNVEKAFAMLDIIGPGNLREAIEKNLRYTSRTQRIAEQNLVRPAGYMPTCDTPDKIDETWSPINPHMQGQLNPNELEKRTHSMQVAVSVKAKSLLKYMIGGPRFFLLDSYDMNVVVRSAVDLFELKRDDFMKIMMKSPGALVDTRMKCMKFMSEYLEPPTDPDIAAAVFGEFPAVKYSRRVLHSGEMRRILADRPFVIPAGTPLTFDNTNKQHHDVFFVLRGEISRVQRRKVNASAGGASDADDDDQAGNSSNNNNNSSSIINNNNNSSPSASFRRKASPAHSGIRGHAGFRRPNTQQSKDGTFSFNSACAQPEHQLLMWPSLSQIFYANMTYAQTVTKRIEGFRVSRGELLKWICSVLAYDDERWKLFRQAIVKPYGHEDRAPLFHALTTDEKTREMFISRRVINANKIRTTKVEEGDGGLDSSTGDGGSTVASGLTRGSSSVSALTKGNLANSPKGLGRMIGRSNSIRQNSSGSPTIGTISAPSGSGSISAPKPALGALYQQQHQQQQQQLLQQPPQGGRRSQNTNSSSTSSSTPNPAVISGVGVAGAGGGKSPNDVAGTTGHQGEQQQQQQQPPQQFSSPRETRSLRESGKKVSIRMEDGAIVRAGEHRDTSLVMVPGINGNNNNNNNTNSGAGGAGDVLAGTQRMDRSQRRASFVGLPEDSVTPENNIGSSRTTSAAASIPGLLPLNFSPVGAISPQSTSLMAGHMMALPPLNPGGAWNSSSLNPTMVAPYGGGRRKNKKDRKKNPYDIDMMTEQQQNQMLQRFRRPMDEAILEANTRHWQEQQRRLASGGAAGRGKNGGDESSSGGLLSGSDCSQELVFEGLAMEARVLTRGGVAHVPLAKLNEATQHVMSSATSSALRPRRSLPASAVALPSTTTTTGPGAGGVPSASSVHHHHHHHQHYHLPTVGGGGTAASPPVPPLFSSAPPLTSRLNGGGGGLFTDARKQQLLHHSSHSLASSVSAPPLAALWGGASVGQLLPTQAQTARVITSAPSSSSLVTGLVLDGPRRQTLAGTVWSYQQAQVQRQPANEAFANARKPVLERLKKK